MAGIVFKCPHCTHSVASDDNLCGEIAVCPECQEEIVVPIPGLEKDNIYGDFKLLARLGTGASGEVWLAHQQSMDRKVALKVLCPKLSSDKTFIERFMKEAKNSAKLAHPNIVTAFYAGQDKGMYYLAISYINGETIAANLERGDLYDEKEALRIIKCIAQALQYAWDEFKILHRDIKPANIIVNKKGIPMLLDLGISKSMKEDSSLTLTGTVVGTPYYMSPEQAVADKNMDFRSDIYSLGTTLYHMLTGKVPHYASTAMAIIMKHINETFEPVRKHNPKVSENCSKLIDIMMAKQKTERQQSWEALITDIDLVLKGKKPSTPMPTTGSSIKNNAAVGKSGKSGKKVSSETPKKNTSSINKKVIAIFAVAAIVLMMAVFGTGIAVFFFFFKAKPAPSTTNSAVTGKNTSQQSSLDFSKPDKSPSAADSNSASAETANTSSGNGYENAFKNVADQLDYTKNSSLAIKTNWTKISKKTFTWEGKVVNVKGGWGKAEITAACPNRMLYRGYNAILVTYDKDAAAKLKIGDTITFTGNVYNYKPKRTGLVIMYMNNVKFLTP